MGVGDERVLADGGPLDGQELDVLPDADEIAVTMLDRTTHRYARSDRRRSLSSGRAVPVFRWAGRE